jgi:hypothetical protein
MLVADDGQEQEVVRQLHEQLASQIRIMKRRQSQITQ